ncbi:MAG: hypothetical protein HY238_26685, partial [Acidobacteria bacterium]|nr:hypothetical protein [Acidobacteriota bacterium]
MPRWAICGLGLLVGLLPAPGLRAADVPAAVANLRRVQALVEAGAAPRTALKVAEEQLRDARNDQVLRDTLYSGNVTPNQVPEMLRAAGELRERAAETLAAQQKLVAAGVLPARALERFEQDRAYADKQWELAQSRARLVEELVEMARREAEMEERERLELALRFEGKSTLSDRDFLGVETAFLEQFSRPLPVSARGTTAVHRSLGFDHRERFDVALNPDQEEGRW